MPDKLLLYLHTYSLRFHLSYKPSFDIFSFIDRAAKEHFNGVCISANDSTYRHLGGTEPWRLPPIKERLFHHNLLCDMDTSNTEPEHLKTMLKVAKAIGAQQLRTYTTYKGTLEELVDQTIKDLKQVAPVANDLGIRVLLENHETFTGAEIVNILDAVNHPWIAALYDYGNSQMVLEDPLECLNVMADYAQSAHLKDHVMLKANDSPDGTLSVLGVPIGDGNLPIIEITKRLLAAGCNRIVFENSYGYRSKVKPKKMTEEALKKVGTGSFVFARNLSDLSKYLLYTERHAPAYLVELEDTMHTRTLSWLRKQFVVHNLR